MDLCVVVPTMARETNGLAYFERTLVLNRPVFDKLLTCVYINEADEVKMRRALDGLVVIPRVSHDATLPFPIGSYAYWRSHLCADFMYAMRAAMTAFPECAHFAWIEDDVLLHPRFLGVWGSRDAGFAWATCGLGATCLVFSRAHLETVALPVVARRYLDDVPLDWMFQLFGTQTPLAEKCSFHIGVDSSQSTSCKRVDESEAYLAAGNPA
jgi:hypothetical protein